MNDRTRHVWEVLNNLRGFELMLRTFRFAKPSVVVHVERLRLTSRCGFCTGCDGHDPDYCLQIKSFVFNEVKNANDNAGYAK